MNRRFGAPVLVMIFLAGCDANQLYLASHTVVGINAGVNPEQTTGKLLVGYDRSFVSVTPRSVDRTKDGVTTQDAMSGLVCSQLVVSGITIKRYTESLATGDAAKNFADALTGVSTQPDGSAKPGVDPVRTTANPAGVKAFFDCFKDAPSSGTKS